MKHLSIKLTQAVDRIHYFSNPDLINDTYKYIYNNTRRNMIYIQVNIWENLRIK